MRVSRVRFTVRRMMVAVAVAAALFVGFRGWNWYRLREEARTRLVYAHKYAGLSRVALDAAEQQDRFAADFKTSAVDHVGMAKALRSYAGSMSDRGETLRRSASQPWKPVSEFQHPVLKP